MSTQMPTGAPPGVPESLITPQGNVPAIGIGTSQDYARLVYAAPYFTTVAIAEIIEPSVTEAVENVLPSLIPPYVDSAVLAGIQQYAVLLTGSTMSGPLFLNPLMPTADAQAATKAYVDTMLATAGIPEVPPVPVGQVWARETGQWTPISQAEGTFLPLTGGSMQGNINMSGNTITNLASVPAMPNGAAPAQWVLNNIAAVSLYQGTWDADTNTPDLTQLSTHVNAWTWIAITTSVSGVVIGAAIPGLQGQTVFNGDTIIYSTAQGAFSSIHAGGISLPEADGRYVQLAGSQMSGALLLNANASQPLQATTLQQLDAAVANTVTPDAPADGQAYLRVGVGTNRWVPGMPLAGGIFTGAVTLAGPGAAGNNPVTVTQMNSAISGAAAGLMPIAGGTFTGPVILSGNATANLNPVPLQQLNSMLGAYVPSSGGTLTGATIIGITNGSSAPAGAVGEFITATQTSIAITNQAWSAVPSITLTPGDWDVQGWAEYLPSGSFIGQAYVQITNTPGTSNANIATSGTVAVTTGGANLSTTMLASGVTRWNVTANTTVYVGLFVAFTSGTCNVASYIRARRVR